MPRLAAISQVCVGLGRLERLEQAKSSLLPDTEQHMLTMQLPIAYACASATEL